MEKRALTRPLAPDVRSKVDVSDIVFTAIDDEGNDRRKVVTVIGRLLFRNLFEEDTVTGNLKVESFPLYIKIVPLLEQIINEGKWI